MIKLFYISVCLFSFFNLIAQTPNTVIITKSGNIGVNKTKPNEMLDVNGQLLVSNNIELKLDFNTNEDMIAEKKIQEKNYDLLPVGSIVMWSKKELPNKNWKLCDGSNGTKDLSSLFIIGEGKRSDNKNEILSNRSKINFSYGSDGGKKEVKVTKEQMPEHTHTIETTTYGLTKADKIKDYTNAKIINYNSIKNKYKHNKTTSTIGNGKSINNIPPYYSLYYIIKIQ